jgi:hypothetical protein
VFKVQQLKLDTAQRQKLEEKVSQRWAHKEMNEDTKAVYGHLPSLKHFDLFRFFQPPWNTVLHTVSQDLPTTEHDVVKVSNFFCLLRVEMCCAGVMTSRLNYLIKCAPLAA